MEKNLTKAAYFFSKACDLNMGMGCGALGSLYEDGKGVEKNSKKATYFYSKACKLGDKEACEMLKKLR
ncbi:tetratricopeptide repeat protein [Helicobacter pylori]|uniref:tetratricopeptide repeat protein n=1 Tax=Helicobacter pylori TaxID=210 RepID=UPI003BAFF537